MDFGSCVLSDSIMASGGQHGEAGMNTVQRCPEMSRNGHISRDMASLMDMKGALLHGVLST